MKNVKQLFLGLLLLGSLSSGAFAKDYGYFWVAGARGFYDDINMGDDKTKYLLTANRKGVPDINRIIRIEAKNRMYWDLSTIQDISKEFSTLLEQKICGDGRYAFTVFMTNEHPDCTVDNFIKKIEKSPIIGNIYAELTTEDGFIYNLNNGTSGRVIQSGEVIMELIPITSPLEVEAKVLNKDVGFIHIGQKVKVKLDSFKFTKYGYIEGIVTNIAKSSILDEKLGEIYPILIELKDDKMKIDNEYVKLMPGMTCSVDVKIGERRLIEYIISPMIRYKDEALREK